MIIDEVRIDLCFDLEMITKLVRQRQRKRVNIEVKIRFRREKQFMNRLGLITVRDRECLEEQSAGITPPPPYNPTPPASTDSLLRARYIDTLWLLITISS